MLLAGLDVGSTGCKVAVYSETGEFMGRTYRDYPVQRMNSEHEVDAKAIWDAVIDVIIQASRKFPDIGGLGVTSFGETFVLLDESGEPLLPAMLYTDPRGTDECAELTAKLGEEAIINAVGVAPAPMYSLPKLMWVKKHRPDIWAKVRRICFVEDYIVYRLTGVHQTDYSMAARSMAFDIHELKWCQMMLNAAEIDVEKLPQPVPTGTAAGKIRPELCAATGLPPETVIVSISHDQVAAAIGSGVFDGNCTVEGAGTVECITPVFDEYDPKKMAKGCYSIVPYIIPGKYVCYAFSFTGGALVDWYINTLAGYAKNDALSQGRDVHELLEKGWKNAPTGLLVLPHFAGAATPYMDTGSRGAIIGLSVENTQEDIYAACMEGVCYEMRLNIDLLRAAGVEVKALRATGGGAKSRTWMQMKADILNIPITALRSEEAGAAGSAMLVGVACGVFADLANAADVMVATAETYYPRSDVHAAYESVYNRYVRLYDAVRPLV